MARIGLFPLELVLVPTERVPLHIFEPRYKELIGECLERVARLVCLLDNELDAIAIDRALRERAQGNGKVTPPRAR
jgi:Lon protease-like protein